MDNSPNSYTFNVTANDLKQIIYFIVNKFRIDPLHIQGTSSRRDLIGGFIDRWINRATEYLVLNYILKNGKREYRVVSDFFLYSQDVEKNAPDVLGLVPLNSKEPKIIFAKFNNGTWKHKEGMPYIEVKANRVNQYNLAVRDTQMFDSGFYVFVETAYNEDYLVSFFYDEFFENEDLLNQIQMSDKFIISDKDSQLIKPAILEKKVKNNPIGLFKLIGIFSGSDYKQSSGLYKEKQHFYYISDIQSYPKKELEEDSYLFEIYVNKIDYGYEINDDKFDYLPIFIIGKCKISFTKKYKTCAYFDLEILEKDVWINQFKLKSGSYRIQFSNFERSSNWREYCASKEFFKELVNILKDYPEASDELPKNLVFELINNFDDLWNSV